MMEIKNIIESLHPLERKVLPLLEGTSLFDDLIKKSGLKDVEVMRALQWLQNKKIIDIKEEIKDVVDIDINGKKYIKEGLPERRFLKALPLPMQEIEKKAKLSKEELNISIGVLKSKAAINFGKDISLTENGKKLLNKEFLEEAFLKKQFPIYVSDLKDEERFSLNNLAKRKNIVKIEKEKIKKISLTELGKKIQKAGIKTQDTLDTLTPSMLKNSSWRNKRFRRYDISINVPNISGGKRHFVNQAIEYARRIWLDMGFKEMEGPLLNTSFWNFDALFVAQDHPVRDLQDTYYIKDPNKGKIPDKKLVENVKSSHENGFNTGSLGWQYKWDPEEAKKLVMRTHTTVLSAKTLAALKQSELPAKFFSFGKCFRNETVDWAHLFEFNQTEGIVVDPDANFRHLLGYLKEFFKKMGFPKARFRPAFFPYTEFSTEIDVYYTEHKKWIELGGAGIFRPEVVKPLLGKDIPVLAWGPGFDRIIMNYFKITDMRDIYKNDLKQLKEMKFWMR